MTETTTEREPWQLTYDDMPDEGFADGLRISTDCLARRVIEPLDPERYHEFPEHLKHRGHGFERVMQEWLERKYGIRSVRELIVPWEYGETHLDLYLFDPGAAFDTEHPAVQLELKANEDAQVCTENVRQVQRQLYVAERAERSGAPVRFPRRIETVDGVKYVPDELPGAAGALLTAEWRLLVIDPTTWRIPDPRGVRVTISDERRAELDAEWEAMHRFMQLSASDMKWKIHGEGDLERLGITCSCGKCFVPPLEALPDTLVEHAAMYLQAAEEEGFAKQERELRRDFLKEQLGALVKVVPDKLEKGRSFVGGGFKVTLTKNGQVRVTRSDATPTVLI